MEDLRKIKSKELLKEAFWRVLEKKLYTQIFIKDVAEEAGVNRKTFTSHYENVDALMRDCIGGLFDQLRLFFAYRHPDGSPDFARSTREYTRFALKNRQRLQLVFHNRLDSVALHLWKEAMIVPETSSIIFPTPAPNLYPAALPEATAADNALRHDLYLNYAIYSCWGNLLWVLEHADLPEEKLVGEALDVFRIYLKDYYSYYEQTS